ncbi:unnamed protein product [Auanema sp. JU1783]|nr:unnamed protein product [Auanema sp. JU1783]
MRQLVKHLKVKRSIEAVFTGGPIVWSPDGKTIFSICTNVVKALNLDNNLESYTIGDPEDVVRITCICLDDDRQRLVVAYNNFMVREYTLPQSPGDKPEVARMWKSNHEAIITRMRFNSDYTLLATGSADYNVKVFDMNNQHCTHNFKGKSVVTSICFTKNDRMFVGYMDGVVNMFDLIKGALEKLIHSWTNHNSQITEIVELKDRRVVALSRDQSYSILEIETREVLKILPVFEPIEAAVLAHNGNLVTVGEEGVMKEWIVGTGKLIRQKKVSNDRLMGLIYNPLKNELLSTSENENIFVLTFADLKLKRQIVGFSDEIYTCCLIGKDQSHLVVGSNTKELRLYNTTTWDCQLISGHTESILSVSCADWDKTIIASASKDSSVILWKLTAGSEETPSTLQPISVATGHTGSVNSVKFSHSAKQPFFCSVSADTTVKLWSLGSNPLKPTTLDKASKLISSSTFVAHAKDVTCLDISLTDSIIVTGGMDKLAKLWQIDDKKMHLGIAGNLSGHRRGLCDAKFAPNAQRVATCGGDLTVKLWCLNERTCLQTFSGHNSSVFNVLFVNHGSQLLSADGEGIIKIWTIATGETENSIEAHADRVWCMSSNADESEYITASSDGKISIWTDISQEVQREEENKLRQKLQEEQTLNNLLEQDRYQEALEFALGLVRPFCAYKVIDTLIERGEIREALEKLDQHKSQVLLDFTTRWNTNSKTSQLGQTVIYHMLHIHHPDELLKLPNITAVVQSLIPYTRRHMERINKSRQDVTLLEFTWDQMRLN